MESMILLGLAFAISLAVGGFMIVAGIGDAPDHRSSHSSITPTGGGLGIVAALGLTSYIISVHSSFDLSPDYAQVLSLVFAAAFLGLMDDILDLAASFKLVVLIIISVAAVWAIGPIERLPLGGSTYALQPWLSWGGSILWVFGVMNIVNFMDGSNGLMLLVMGLASFFLGWAAYFLGAFEPFIMLILLSTSIAGIAVYNLRQKALIFSGDVGSLSIGLVFAIGTLWICRDTNYGSPVYIGPVLILPFIADAFFTMLRRARRGDKLMEAHRTHLYQRMAQGGMSHVSIAFIYGVATLLMALYARSALENGYYQYINFPILPALMLSSVYMLAGRRFS